MYEHILISTDGSDLACKGVESGLALAKSLGARVTIISVADGGGMRGRAPKWDPISGERPGYEDSLDQDEVVDEVLSSAKARAEQLGVEADTLHVADVHPADAILAAADARGCQLIAMASHGRSGLGRMLLGSQTSDVLARSAIPVLVVR